MAIGKIDNEFAVREGWARDSEDEIYMDGYNAFIQITTNDGTSGFSVKNDIGNISFSSKSDGDGYVAKKLGVGTFNPSTELEVIGRTKTNEFQLPTGAVTGYVLTADANGVGTWQDAYSGGGGASLTVQEDDVDVTTNVSTLNFEGDVTVTDEGSGKVTVNIDGSGVGLDAYEHSELDQLVHNIAEDSFDEIARGVCGKVSQMTTWDSVAMSTKIRDQIISRHPTTKKVSSIVTKQFDGSGVLVEQITEQYTRDARGRVISITRTQDL